MTINTKPKLSDPLVLFLSFFGVGFFPKAPGTMGSVATLPFLYLAMVVKAPGFLFIPLLVVSTIMACFAAELVQRKYDLKDPGWIVLDEVLGMVVCFLFLQEPTILHLFILFVLFRFFDIFKIWPASYFDSMKHGAGVIVDDLISGVYAGLVYLLINYFLFS